MTGQAAGELSNAGTTGLLDVATGDWATDLAASIGIDPQILPTPERAGRLLGEYDGTPVHLVAAHDTACAFAASPLAVDGPRLRLRRHVVPGRRRACLPDVSEEARLANFSNERGALGGFRFLKNVPGFWLLEQCAAQWGTNAVDLLGVAARAPSNAPRFDVTDERLLAPARMADVVRAAAGLTDDAPRALIARSVVESLAAAVAGVVDQLRATSRWRSSSLSGAARPRPS